MTTRNSRRIAAALVLMLVLTLLAAYEGPGRAAPAVPTEAPAAEHTSEPEPELTPGPEPTPEPLPRYADGEASLQIPSGPLAISEITTTNGDLVELVNVSGQDVLLSDYYLSDKNTDRLKLRLPEDVLAPGAFYVVEGLSLSVKGDRLWLSDARETVLDYARIENVPPGGSYGRIRSEAGWFYFSSPSLGEENAGGLRRVSEEPTASVASGAYDGVTDGLTIELQGSGTIYYTLDGQKPDMESAVYTGPIRLTGTTVVRAVSVEPDAVPSRVATYNYFLNEGHALPIVAFSADDYDAWFSHYSGHNRFGEYAGTAALYREGEEVFNLDCGLQLKGFSAVLDPMKKNFGFFFRGRYGDGDLEDCDLFDNGVTSYSSLLLRAGQDHHAAIIRNEVMQELCLAGSSVLPAQHGVYCVVYMNGHYKGIYSLKENMNDHFFGDLYGVSPESVTTLRVRADVEKCEELQEIFDLGEHADMTDPENYARFCELIDIDNYIDYILFEGFSGNTDLLENVRYFKSPEIDQRWRLAFFDLDCAFYEFYGGMRCVFESYAKPSHEITFMSRNLIHNAQFRDRLLSRYAQLLRGVLSPEYVTATMARLANEIEPEVTRDRVSNGISRDYWDHMMDQLYRFGTIDYTRATIEALRQDLDMSREEVERYFGEWL
ncbi:MAG: CotH kinase family protein [Oscillospiraceae bacterium]|nr:CotH kinase family protein [Oscillospiraceae bacterium]